MPRKLAGKKGDDSTTSCCILFLKGRRAAQPAAARLPRAHPPSAAPRELRRAVSFAARRWWWRRRWRHRPPRRHAREQVAVVGATPRAAGAVVDCACRWASRGGVCLPVAAHSTSWHDIQIFACPPPEVAQNLPPICRRAACRARRRACSIHPLHGRAEDLVRKVTRSRIQVASDSVLNRTVARPCAYRSHLHPGLEHEDVELQLGAGVDPPVCHRELLQPMTQCRGVLFVACKPGWKWRVLQLRIDSITVRRLARTGVVLSLGSLISCHVAVLQPRAQRACPEAYAPDWVAR